ncbi:hypothetical protein N1851_023154 [Merluccius polli]|uniref:Uncharacterized protein n=1 Tax=Merluccius polli TaxID=89951 RepID=A0AA47MGY6_MERPO|nr:hypothetical protein N1851_023154 [Merluccius polli]
MAPCPAVPQVKIEMESDYDDDSESDHDQVRHPRDISSETTLAQTLRLQGAVHNTCAVVAIATASPTAESEKNTEPQVVTSGGYNGHFRSVGTGRGFATDVFGNVCILSPKTCIIYLHEHINVCVCAAHEKCIYIYT